MVTNKFSFMLNRFDLLMRSYILIKDEKIKNEKNLGISKQFLAHYHSPSLSFYAKANKSLSRFSLDLIDTTFSTSDTKRD